MANLFAKAKTIDAPKASKKDTKVEVQMPGLKSYAEVDALIKSLTSLKESLGSELKSAGLSEFIKMSEADGKRPDSFRGIDDDASGSIELRRRSTTSAISEDEAKLLRSHNLEPKKEIITNKLFGINPAYAENDALLEKVSKALDGIVPEDFIVVQEERSKLVATDEILDKAFNLHLPREVIETLTVMAIKPKLAVTNVTEIMDRVKALIGEEDGE
jgi:hypothetical protein